MISNRDKQGSGFRDQGSSGKRRCMGIFESPHHSAKS